MKKILPILLIFISNISFSQTLENTEWEIYFDGYYEINVLFKSDTFFIKEYEEFEPFSVYSTNLDSFMIMDLDDDEGDCFDMNGFSYIGSYLYSIENDTLFFDLLEDSCEFRLETLVGASFVRAGTTSVENVDAFGEVILFPNPLGDGILNIQSEEKLDQISVYDSYGKLLMTIGPVSSIDLSSFTTSLFFVELQKGNKSTFKKVININ